jgi:hypothetical protein
MGACACAEPRPAHHLMPVAMRVPVAQRLAAHVGGRKELDLVRVRRDVH